MIKALTTTQLTERFTEHDLRAKVASDTDLSHASLMLGHSQQETTERLYRRKHKLIKQAQ